MKIPISKTKRLIYKRRIKYFWEEFHRHKIGVAGTGIILFYVLVAIFSPYLIPYDPYMLPRTAKNFAMPAWVTIFPGFEKLPPTMIFPLNWNFTQNTAFIKTEQITGTEFKISYDNQGTSNELETIESNINFTYEYAPPPIFLFSGWYRATNLTNTRYIIQFIVRTPNDTQLLLWEQNSTLSAPYAMTISGRSEDRSFRLFFYGRNFEEFEILTSTDPKVLISQEYKSKQQEAILRNPCDDIFAVPGLYSLTLRVSFKPRAPGNASAIVSIITAQQENAQLTLWGHVHGILGTDYLGKDVWSQVVYGARISLVVGLLASVLAISMGIIIGVTAGYIGGIIDEGLMRMVDILLCLPVLPILLVLISIWGASVWYIIIIIAIFGWQGLSRIIRSRVLSLKEMFFVESARASGASSSYIILRHIVPNIMPIAISAMILSVPSAILTEATLSFIGFGDPTVPTWGRLLHLAEQTGAFSRLAWWVIFPPGIAISLLCLGFVLIGHALDEILNPKLRRRR